MQKEYTSPEIVEIGQAQFVVQGEKGGPPPDFITGDEQSGVLDWTTDVDE